ncbi:PTS transporter subunit EIIC [Gracilibacillus timonensis]|uniref:PTS transporter subunit EIIC n=1 Tax=Gracilibacillus timonensis TaxID=1816696 RepID=UPI000824CBB3|nr:PTS transporter subunit EIIC [Gracilibacillus timonensis]
MRTMIQKFGRTLLGPLSIIIASGLLLGIVSILQNPSLVGETISEAYYVQTFIDGVQAIVSTMFSLLPILFAISVATGLARDDKEIAGLAVVIGFMLFNVVISFLLELNGITGATTSVEYLMDQGHSEVEAFQISSAYETVLGVFTFRMSIFSGILVGLWTAFIHNKFHTQQLPAAFSFFSGNRFVPIMIIATMPFVSIVMYFIWPYFNEVINSLGSLISTSGAFGTFLYGFSERLLIPTGLHHVLNQLLRFTPFGGTAEIDGQLVSGALNIFNAQLSLDNPDMGIMRDATRFLSQGVHAFQVFGLPAAAFAMYKAAKPEKRRKVKGMLIAAGLTTFATGITEPIEFAFIFISPILWIFHALMAGLSFMLMTLFGVAVGNAAGGLIDLTIFGILQGTYTKWPIIVAVGLCYSVIYYFVFKFVIEKFNIKTPGREDSNGDDDTDEDTMESASESTMDKDDLGVQIMEAIGGKENITDIDNCISRLRLVLEDTSLVDEAKVKRTGSMGIVVIDKNNIQIVYGAKVEQAARALKSAVKNA